MCFSDTPSGPIFEILPQKIQPIKHALIKYPIACIPHPYLSSAVPRQVHLGGMENKQVNKHALL